MSTNYAKIIAQKWNGGRDVSEVRKRNSTRLKELRRSKRSTVLNQFRKGLDLSEEVVKKSAAEEKLDRLKAYKVEKKKKMEELKKKQRPPFCSIVKIRHTGGTPFRETDPQPNKIKCVPLKNPVTSLSTTVRTRSKTQNPFEFKATLTDTKKINIKSGTVKVAEKLNTKKPPIPLTKKVVKPPLQVPGVSSSGPTLREPVKPVVEKKITVDKGRNVAVKKNSSEKENTFIRPQRAVQAKKNIIKPEITKPKSVLEPSKGKTKNTKIPETHLKGGDASKERKNNNNVLRNRDTNKKVNVQSDTISAKGPEKNTVTTRSTRGRPRSRQEVPVTSKNEKKVQEEVKVQQNEMEIESLAGNQNVDLEKCEEGTDFHRSRLKNEIERLTNEADAWSRKGEEDIPEHIKDEILAVVGQTRLLLSQKFRDFKNLIDKCESQPKKNDIKVTLEDLAGFWDMMYQQVIQLDRKYRNLYELGSNNWEEKIVTTSNNKTKKVLPKRKTKNQAPSRFRDFLKSKKQSQTTVERPSTPDTMTRAGDLDDSSFYHSANRAADGEIPDVLKTPKFLPGVQRTIMSDRKSRRSSAGLVILRQRLLMKSISSPQKTID